MNAVLVMSGLALAAMFLISGTAKLADRPGTTAASHALGVPSVFAPWVAWTLPVLEIALAASILIPATSRAGAIASVLLLTAFAASIAVAIARGRRVDCHCFGQISGGGPISWKTVARNVLFIAIAILGTVRGFGIIRGSNVRWLSSTPDIARAALATCAVFCLLAILLALVVLQLVRQNGRILNRLDAVELTSAGLPATHAPAPALPAGLSVGTAAPPFALPGLDGETVTLDSQMARGRPLLLTFIDPGCGPCTDLVPELAGWQRQLRNQISVIAISRGSRQQNVEKLAGRELAAVVLQRDREIANVYQSYATPSAVLVDVEGRIAGPVVSGNDAIRRLMRQISTGQPTSALALQLPAPVTQPAVNGHQHPVQQQAVLGQAVPDIALATLEGRPATIAGRRSKRTIILLWNPGCGFCQRMLNDLRSWEIARPGDASDLLVVSSGNAETNREMGLRSPIVLDDAFRVGLALGARGTPSAVEVDVDGNLASTVTVGAPAVLDLLRQGPGRVRG